MFVIYFTGSVNATVILDSLDMAHLKRKLLIKDAVFDLN